MQQPFCFSRSFAENSAARTCPRRRSCVKIQTERRACARPRKKRKLVVIVLQTGLRRTDTDMTRGSVLGQLVAFSVPLLIGNIFQQLYNTVDSVVVGNFVGKEALAAVGSVGPVINMLIGFFNGFATGAGVVISRHYGARQRENVRTAVQTTIAMTILMSIVLSVLGVVLTPALLRMMQTPEEVLAHASEYLQIYFAGLSGLLLYNMGAGILRAVGDTRRPLYFLIFSAVTNTVLDLLFVTVFRMGVAGVAIATILAQFASAALVLAVLTRTKGDYRIEWRAVQLEKNMLGSICALGLPSAVQLAVTAFSNIFVQSYINRFGADCMAGWTSYNKIDSFALLPITTISLAVTTFVGQNLGAGDHARAKKGTRTALLLSEAVTVVVLLPLMLLEDLVKECIQQGKIVFFSSHQMNYVEEFCNEIAILNQGKIVLSGNIRDIKRGYERNRLLVSTRQTEAIRQWAASLPTELIKQVDDKDGDLLITLAAVDQKDAFLTALTGQGFDLDGFQVYEPSLNDIFVSYTEGAV